MKESILANFDNPAQLEKLYRSDKTAFAQAFHALYPDNKDSSLAVFWHERLTASQTDMNWGTRPEQIWVIIASLLAGIIAKLPAIFQLEEEPFYTRNAGFVIFPVLTTYFALKNKLPSRIIAAIAGAMVVAVLFINVLPIDPKSDTLLLSCIHLPLFLWAVLGFAYVGNIHDTGKRLCFLKFNGDLVVMTTLILIAGVILTGITIGLFSLIGLEIKEFYFNYVVLFGLPAAPILGTYLTQTNPHLVGKVSPVIAKIFSPLVLVMLVIYLAAIVYSGKDPYNDREFLLMFNLLLIGVMAIIFFSVAETGNFAKNRLETWVLLLLSMVTIVVNGIAMSAIVFRINEWGITPNRAAVLGGNVLILLNLLLVAAQLYRVASKQKDISAVGNTIALYLPIYGLWATIVTFLFPLLFGFA